MVIRPTAFSSNGHKHQILSFTCRCGWTLHTYIRMYVLTLTYIWISAILAALYCEDPTHIAQIPPILYFAVYIHMYIRTSCKNIYVCTYIWQRCTLLVSMLRWRSMYVNDQVNCMIESYLHSCQHWGLLRTFTRACVVQRGSSPICKWEMSNMHDCYCTPFIVK